MTSIREERAATSTKPRPSPEHPLITTGTVLLRAWRVLTAMRTAIVLLLLLALAALPGSLLPQRGTAPGAVARYQRDHETLGPLFDRLWLFEVYAAPWFAAVYLLLLIAMTGCVLPRTIAAARSARQPLPDPPSTWTRLEQRADVQAAVGRCSDRVLDPLVEELRRRHWRVRLNRQARTVTAEKGRLREVGNLVFHSSLLLLLYGMAYGQLRGYEGRAIVVVGAGFSNTVTSFDEFRPGAWVDRNALEPFSFTVEDFQAVFEANGPNRGAPRDFSAQLLVRDSPGASPRRQTLRVNGPLEVNGSKAFLTGHGYAPRFTVRDGAGAVVFEGPSVFLPRDGTLTSDGVIKVPDASPTPLGFKAVFLPTAVADGDGRPFSVFPDATRPFVLMTVYTGDLGLSTAVPQSVYQLDTSRMQPVLQAGGSPAAPALAVGDTFTLPGGQGSITFDGVSRFINVQLAYDPGRGASLLAAVLLLSGLSCSLLIRQRRLFARVGVDGQLELAVRSATRRGAPDGEVADLIRSLHQTPARKDREAMTSRREPAGGSR